MAGPPSPFDERWKRRALDGEPAAIRLLAAETLQPLFRFCLYRVGGDRALCEDVVQETMRVAIERLDSYDPVRSGGSIWGWLTGLARNEVRRAMAGERRSDSLELLLERADERLLEAFQRLGSEALAEHDLERAETREMVNLAMSQLPQLYRQALEAKYVEGHTVRRFAQDTRQTEDAVASLLARARQAFRESFEILSRPAPRRPDALPEEA